MALKPCLVNMYNGTVSEDALVISTINVDWHLAA